MNKYTLEPGQIVRIAYHAVKRCFSIRDAKTRRVIGYTDRIVLRNVSFVVSQAGRERVLREREKNVHAYVIGLFEPKLQQLSRERDGCEAEAYYNPYYTLSFVNKSTKEPLSCADLAICEERHVYYR
ncbi:hypothetical protein [Paenibacillus sp. H1-7]|uniref:hypothetical protein n=1 Tax=Paenibacillus sp. H1-7 TaxID=2282849 RepID=UPI001EF84B7B|nr:hypothetical protein [Paenibacillus sp. H1-7]